MEKQLNEEKQFIRLRECNNWEGETWNFYIPVTGNEEAIKKLAVLIENYQEHTLYPIPIGESEIDVLVKNDNRVGYMARYNKLEGKLDFTGFPDKSTNGAEDPFYKGDIQKYLKEE